MTDTIWYIIHAIVAAVAFSVGFRIAAEIREWRNNTENIEREIPFALFLEAYGKAPDRWTLLPYYVRYGKDDVRFENYADYRKYQKWREKRKRDEEAERKREANEALYREIQSDIIPTPPTTGSSATEPKPPIIYGRTNGKRLYLELLKEAERQERIEALKEVPITVYNPAEESVKRYEHDFIDVKCGKCRQFDKGDNSPLGYCFRNDEIVNEASAKGCFEPKSKAEEHPKPLGTVTTY